MKSSILWYSLYNCNIQLQNVAPDDGLKSPKHVEHLMINKDSLEEFVHLVGLLIYTLQYDAWCIQRQICRWGLLFLKII